MLQNPWQINLFGGFAIKQRSRETSLPLTNQMALLLAMLADRLGRPLQRADLIEELWPGVEVEVGRNRFRVLLAELRRLLEPPGTPSGSVLSCDRTIATLSANACRADADDFQRHIQKANQSTVAEERIEHYKAADQLYTGDFMAGRQGDWIFGRRSHYARLQSLAQFRFSALLEESGDLPGAMLQIARAIEADPLREAPRKRALRLMVVAGEVGSALNEYDEYQKLLKRSVGLAPTAEFQDWIKKLKAWAGTHRTSGAGGPVASSSVISQAPAPTEMGKVFLPPALTTFVGRAADIAELSDLLPLYRWITLTGPGGIGKTRLAIETARANAPLFGGGVIYVPGSDLPGSSSLIESILQQIQIESSAEPLETLRQYLAQPVESGRNACLLVLDGMDQLSSESNQVVQRLLTEVPNATVLATARKRRGSSGEQEYPVGPLAVPDAQTQWDQLLVNASVQLFAERAQAASPRFTMTKSNAPEVIALCRRLEGIPLAIELAAAQAGKVSPTEILLKLGDTGSLDAPKNWREPRHRSLQASLAFSLDALEPAERQLFCALCVFRGGFDAAAAAIVAGATTADLSKLAEHSLLTKNFDSEHRRYTMLDMVREFGWSKLSAPEKTAVQDRHVSYFHKLAADAETLHFSSGIQQLTKLRLEAENLRLAVDWMIRKGDAESSVRLAGILVSVWSHLGFQREGRDLVDRVRGTLNLNALQTARLDAVEGSIACLLDDAETARNLIGRALPVLESLGLHQHAAGARWSLAFAAYLGGDYDHAISYASQIEPGVGAYHVRMEAFRRNLLGMAYCEMDMLDEALLELQIAERIWQELGDLLIGHFCHLTVTRVAWKRGQLAEAWTEYQAAAAAFDAANDPRGLSYSVDGLGRVAVGFCLYSQAARLLGAAQRLRDSIGLRRDFADKQVFEEAVDAARKGLGRTFDSEWQAGYGILPNRMAKWVAEMPEPWLDPVERIARDA